MKRGESKRKKKSDSVVQNNDKNRLKSASVVWRAPEFRYKQKDYLWHLSVMAVGIIFILIALWQKNFLFAAFILIAWFVIVYWANKKPTTWEFKLDEKGIYIILPGEDFDKFYSYSEIDGFDIHQAEEKNKELMLKLKAKLSPYLKIIFPAIQEKEITGFLAGFLPREEYEKTFSDSFLELIGF